MREELVRSGSTTAVFPRFDRCDKSDSSPCTVDEIEVEFGNVIFNKLLGLMFVRQFVSDYFK